MGQSGSTARSGSGRSRSGSTSSTAAGPSALGSSNNALLKPGTGIMSGHPPLKPKEYLGPDGGFYVPMSGIYPNVPQEWDAPTVVDLIDKRKMAPFYRGLQDELKMAESDPAEQQVKQVEANLESIGVKPDAEPVGHHGRIGMRNKEPAAHKKAEMTAYLRGTDECPICMMNFPSNMNTARCCGQPICTECLVQIKRQDPDPTHIEPEPVACPFCVEPDFGILYEAPPPPQRRDNKGVAVMESSNISSTLRNSSSRSSSSDNTSANGTAGRPRRKSVPADTPEVVTIDELHPNFHAKVELMQATVARRANRRIVFRRAGDRLIPVGITSSRGEAANATGGSAAAGGSSSGRDQGSTASAFSPRRMRRNRNNGSRGSNDFSLAGQDLEQMMVNEAIRLSLASAEEDARRSSNAEQEQRNQQASGTSAATHSDTVTAAASDPATGDAQYVSAQTDSLPVPTTLSQADPLVAESLQPADVGQEAAAPPATDANQNNTSGYQNLRDSEADDASVKGSPVIQHDEARPAAAR